MPISQSLITFCLPLDSKQTDPIATVDKRKLRPGLPSTNVERACYQLVMGAEATPTTRDYVVVGFTDLAGSIAF